MTLHVTALFGDPRLPDAMKVGGRFGPEDLEAFARARTALGELDGYTFEFWDDHGRLLDDLQRRRPAFVLNFCDTGYRNVAATEPLIPALLELLGIPYSGAGPTCLGMCYDKALVRAVAMAHGIAVPRENYLEAADPDADVPWTFPCLIKPNRGDGSIGITQHAVVQTVDEGKRYLARLRDEWPGRGALVQEFLNGTELGIALVGNVDRGFVTLPPLEVDYGALDAGLPHILSYESKAVPESPYWTQLRFRRAQLDQRTLARLIGWCEILFTRLCCRDYARFDFRADARGEIKLLEVNPNPAWCWDGKLNMMAEHDGMRYGDLLRLLLDTARARALPGAS